MPIPSSLPFASFLQYSPRGTNENSKFSRVIVNKFKNNSFYKTQPMILYTVEKLVTELPNYPYLREFFNPNVSLVPMPRSSPIKPGSLWPGEVICKALIKKGLASGVLPCIQRTTPVQKAAFAPRGMRPDPQEHHDSVKIHLADLFVNPTEITLVDDVITRGSSFLGILPRVQKQFPNAQIRCFAMIRTISPGEIDAYISPVNGSITWDGKSPRRTP